jgi:acyl-CoA synthetase (AMP-forming)/AMP-acid ligase II
VLLPEQLRLMAESFPAETAYTVVDRGSLTFAAWDQSANRLARGLVTAGLGPDDRVGIHLAHEEALEWLVAYAAVHRAGGVAVPLNPRLAPAEVARMLAHCGARAVVAASDLAVQDADLPVTDGGALSLAFVVDATRPDGVGTVVRGDAPGPAGVRRVAWDDLLDGDASDFQVPRSDEDLADILYTSGTTGNPKGVAVRHANASLIPYGVPTWSGTAWLHASPFYTFAGMASVYNPMKLGMRGLYLPRFDAGHWFAVVAAERPTAVFLVPAMAQLLLAHPGFESADLTSIQLCSIGSAPLSPQILEKMQERMPDALVSNNYGMTEAGSAYCVMPKGEAVRRPGSVGQPAPPAEVKIVDADGDELPHGEVGEVRMRVPGRSREYFGDAEATAATWVDGWLRTGDLGKVDDDGYLYIVGREKDVIIRGGNNIHATDVEHAILSHPAVLEVAVVGVPHEVLGEDVVGVVVLRPGATATGDELRAHTLELLADYKVPRQWVFVDELPRNATGKVVKAELRRRLTETAPAAG